MALTVWLTFIAFIEVRVAFVAFIPGPSTSALVIFISFMALLAGESTIMLFMACMARATSETLMALVSKASAAFMTFIAFVVAVSALSSFMSRGGEGRGLIKNDLTRVTMAGTRRPKIDRLSTVLGPVLEALGTTGGRGSAL